ncbi:MAG: hypothetical protein GWN82_08200, partial [Gemmatimonadetes bacterium]|nr:hypothetical protein [Gemmatimonadota bacterium]NIU30692.1 hypothetical protein [Gemmatimonadota bacterium]NIV61050.1 hypothetical protein [Gemmatimonadota bacterium]NIX39080.1 hypothetical protein [Gemmatimonadota bacterium]
MLALSAGALFVGKRQKLPVLGLVAAAGSVGVLAVYLLRARPDTLFGVFEVVGFSALLGVLFHLAIERSGRSSAQELRL